MKTSIQQYRISDSTAMENLGARVANACGKNPLLIFLVGELGAGKTTFVRGFLQALGHQGAVKSPTFTLLESYELPDRKILHFDLYRLKSASEFEAICGEDFANKTSTTLIEWPDKLQAQGLGPDLLCTFQVEGTERLVDIEAIHPACLEILKK